MTIEELRTIVSTFTWYVIHSLKQRVQHNENTYTPNVHRMTHDMHRMTHFNNRAYHTDDIKLAFMAFFTMIILTLLFLYWKNVCVVSLVIAVWVFV